MAESRDSIKSRMLRTVANIWDYPGVENEATFDPLVALLINACAAELAKINRDKKLSQSRLMEEVARLLIPDAKTRAVPAHGIVSASPSKSKSYVSTKEELLYKESKAGSDNVERYFSPTAQFPLVNAEVKYQASDNNISKIVDHKYKNVLGYTQSRNSLPAATLYVGIDIDDKISSVDEFTFFFNLLNVRRKDFFFSHLKTSSWYIGDQALEKHPGYPTEVNRDENLEDLLTKRYQTNDKTCGEINQFYERQFFTVQNLKDIPHARGNMPVELQQTFDTDILNEVEDNLLWLRAEFSNAISPVILNDVFCFTNCFPVLNRKIHDIMFRLQDNLNIIPLKTSDFFFDIKQIIDSDGDPYHLYRAPGDRAAEDNSVLLRTSGVGRFGAFEAKEELHYLLETLKDETASYAAIGTEKIEGIVSEINVLVGDLEDKVSDMSSGETISYLVMRNLEESDSLFIEYWTTGGAKANTIAAGEHLEVRGHSSVKSNSTHFITPTVGGKNRLSEAEKLTSFKQTMLANDRLVTNEDLKTFCREQLGGRISSVEITKGLANGMSAKAGLVRTIDIQLTSTINNRTKAKEWEFLLDDLLTKIGVRVTHSFPYRILLDGDVMNKQNPTYHE